MFKGFEMPAAASLWLRSSARRFKTCLYVSTVR
jgi:hypothetical protein